MIKTYSQMHRTDKCSQHSSISKWLSVRLRTKWLLVRVQLKSLRLRSLDFNEGERLQIIRALNLNKAHGHDDISIRMIKTCHKLLLKPLVL